MAGGRRRGGRGGGCFQVYTGEDKRENGDRRERERGRGGDERQERERDGTPPLPLPQPLREEHIAFPPPRAPPPSLSKQSGSAFRQPVLSSLPPQYYQEMM